MEAREHKCVVCDNIYSTSTNLYRHVRLKHSPECIVFGNYTRLKCPLCRADFVSKKTLEHHFKISHEITIIKQKREFSSLDEFFAWKNYTENKNSAMYFKHGSSKEKCGVKTSYYHCHRSGFYKRQGNGKRNIKFQGTNKINGNCPAMMKVVETVPKIVVEYTKTHVGHTNDIRRMKLEESERHAIVAKLVNKIPITAILDNIRDSVSTHLERIHLLTRRDITNIKAQYNISSNGVWDSHDAVIADNLATNMQNNEDYFSLLDKPQNVACPELNEDNCKPVSHLPFEDPTDMDEHLFVHCSERSSDMNNEKELQINTLKHKSNEKIALKRKMYCDMVKYIEECDSVTDLQKLQKVFKNVIASHKDGKSLEEKTIKFFSRCRSNKKGKQRFVSSRKECVLKNHLSKSTPEELQEISCTLILNADSNYEPSASNMYIIANDSGDTADKEINVYYSS